jgi:hypothetical protein
MNFTAFVNNVYHKNAGIMESPYKTSVSSPAAPVETKTTHEFMAPEDKVEIDFPPAGNKGSEAEIVRVMAEILSTRDKGNLNLSAMARELEKRGYSTRLLDTGEGKSGNSKATIEIIATDGTKVAFKDEDGDGQMGMVDKQFRDAVKTHVPELYQKLVDKSNAESRESGHESNIIGADGNAKTDKWSSAKATGFQGGAQTGPGTTGKAPQSGTVAKETDPVNKAQQNEVQVQNSLTPSAHYSMMQILDKLMENLRMLGINEPGLTLPFDKTDEPSGKSVNNAEAQKWNQTQNAPEEETV